MGPTARAVARLGGTAERTLSGRCAEHSALDVQPEQARRNCLGLLAHVSLLRLVPKSVCAVVCQLVGPLGLGILALALLLAPSMARHHSRSPPAPLLERDCHSVQLQAIEGRCSGVNSFRRHAGWRLREERRAGSRRSRCLPQSNNKVSMRIRK